MDLRSDAPFWLLKNGLIYNYPPLSEDSVCDVLIIGGGVTGALVAHALVGAGLSVIVMDRREIAQGSTSASTALLQYEIDTHLVDLVRKIGTLPAVRAYQLCLNAISELEQMIGELPHDCEFCLQPSLYLASQARDVKLLQAECALRAQHGFPVRWCSPDDLNQEFGITGWGGILSMKAATVDPFQLTHHLLTANVRKGLRVFDRTTITDWQPNAGMMTVETDRSARVQAKTVVFACGYEAQSYLRERIVSLRSTYAFVTGPDQRQLWKQNAMIWESARPYLYLRRTRDGRILVGGEDDPFRSPQRRDGRIDQKTERLMARITGLFPDHRIDCEYAWAGTFGETKDGLGYIGTSSEIPDAFFALGFGGNGITFSVVASQILRDLIVGRPNPDSDLFRFGR